MRDDILVIQKKGCTMYTRPKEASDAEGGMQYPTYGLIGIMNIESHIFVILISERQLVAKMPSGDFVYLIQRVEFIPFDKNIIDYKNMPVEIVKYVDGIKKVLEQ